MRNHRSERVGRKPYHCLSARQKRRIRKEMMLIQESVEAESKKNRISVESGTSQNDDCIPQQGPPVYVQSQEQSRVPQFAQQSISFSTSQVPQVPFSSSLLHSTVTENFSCSANFLAGPSGCQDASPAENGISSTFKTEPFSENNQQGIIQQNSFVHSRNSDENHNSEILLELRKLNAKLETYNNHFLSINARLEAIERHVKQEKRKGQAPPKPSNIPMQTVQEVIEFDSANDEDYKALVQYLKYIGGFTLREALNLCMKEVLTNDVANNFTWHGKDTGHAQVGLALYSRQITNAFYEAVSQSQHFEQPTRAMFASQMREVLRIAKQRLRNSLRKQQVQQNFDGDRDDDPWE